MGDRPARGQQVSPEEPPESGAYRGPSAESSRVEALSDGVFAIAITLPVLDLRAPEHRGTALRDLLAQWPAYVAYLASFAYIGVIWVNHHQLFTRIARVSAGLLWRNLALLLTTSVLPFPTAVVGSAFQLGDRADQSAALVFYAGVGQRPRHLGWCCSTSSRALLTCSKTRLMPPFFARERHRAAVGITLYAISAFCAVWYPLAGLTIACVLPVFYGITSAGRRSAALRGH